MFGHTDVVGVLLANNANINLRNHKNETALKLGNF